MEDPFVLIWDKLNDASWALLDGLYDRGVPIVEFFDSYRLPPLLFPLAIILLVFLSLYMIDPALVGMPIPPPPPPEQICGDGICAGPEICSTCPADCGECMVPITRSAINTTSVDVIISLGSARQGIKTVSLLASDGSPLRKVAGTRDEFRFNDIPVAVGPVIAKAESGNGKSVSSPAIYLDADPTIITLDLTPDFFRSDLAFGTLSLAIVDNTTGDPLDAHVIVLDPVRTRVFSSEISGSADIELRAGNWYELIVEKQGFQPFFSDRFFVPGMQIIEKRVSMLPAGLEPEAASLSICMKYLGTPGEGGSVSIFSSSGVKVADIPLSSFSNDCHTLPADPGIEVFLSVESPPAGCSATEARTPVAINGPASVTLTLDCETSALLGVIVYGHDDVVLTGQATVTLWASGNRIPGSGPFSSLDSSGDQTELIAVPAGVPITIRATGVPLGYAATDSIITLLPGEERIVSLRLGIAEMLPLPIIADPLLQPTLVASGETITASALDILLDDSPLGQGDISLICETSWGLDIPATYDASASRHWSCSLTAPDDPGQHSVVLRASSTTTTDATELLDLEVLPLGSEPLTIVKISSPSSASLAVLEFEISLDGVPVTDLEGSVDLSLIGVLGPVFISRTSLSPSATPGLGGYFSADVSLPFAGEYKGRAEVSGDVDGQAHYGVLTFPLTITGVATIPSLSGALSRVVVAPGETLDAFASLTLGEEPLPSQTILLELGTETHSLFWVPASGDYRATLTAPLEEGTYPVDLFVAESPSVSHNTEFLYVVDSSLPGAPCPPVALCSDILEARGCKAEYDSGIIEIDELLTCIRNGMTPFGCDFDGLCDSAETCLCPDCNGQSSICPLGQSCRYPLGVCEFCDFNGLCEGGEDASNCPSDCRICDSPGDFNGNGGLDLDDLAELRFIVSRIQSDGKPYLGDFGCADVNSDGFITIEDVACMDGILDPDSGIDLLTDCPDCSKHGEYEICADSVDNNCDGQIDRETWMGVELDDQCDCSAETSCFVKQGFIFGSDFEQSCVSRDWLGEDPDMRQWTVLPDCSSSMRCETFLCGGGEFICTDALSGWAWTPLVHHGAVDINSYDSICLASLASKDYVCCQGILSGSGTNLGSYTISLSQPSPVSWLRLWGDGELGDATIRLDLYLDGDKISESDQKILQDSVGERCPEPDYCYVEFASLAATADEIRVKAASGRFNLKGVEYYIDSPWPPV